MHWRNDAEQALAGRRPDEPRNLRVDILDEIADHLALATERERERGLENEAAIWTAVLEKFGNPTIVVQQMWWEAMRGAVMKQWTLQILLILAGGIVGAIVGFALWAMIWQQDDLLYYVLYQYILVGFFAGTLPVLVILALLQPGEHPILRMLFSRMFWKRIAIGAAVVFVVASVVIAILNYILAGKLDTLTEDMKARGVIVDLKTLATTRPEGTVFYEGPWESSIYGFLFSAEAGGDWLNPQNADPGEWSWSIYKLKINFEDIFSTEDPETVDKIRGAVMEQQEFINRLKSLATQPPVSPEMMHKWMTNYPTLVETFLPNLLAVRNFANLLAMDASVKWRNGDVDGALENCGVIIQLGRHIADQPLLISQMIAVALGGIAVQSIAAMGINADYSDATIANIDPLLANAFEQDLIAKSLRGELFGIWQIFREMDRLDSNVWERARYNDGIWAWAWFYGLPVFDAWRAYDEMTYLRIMEPAIEQSMLPYYEQTGVPEAHALDWRTPISSEAIPNLLRCNLQTTDMHAQFSLARIALALTRYKRDTGAYPETLEALVPTYLAEIPEDPFSGNRMPYRVGPEGYLLSSTGWNGKDDLLKTDEKRTIELNGFNVVACDDIVWCPNMNKLRRW